MQNNEYREWLMYGCSLMEQTTYWLFCSAMDLSFTEELKDILHPGEAVELPADILLTMEDWLIQRIGKTVEESIQLLHTLKNINNLGDSTTHSFLHNTYSSTEEAISATEVLSYTEQVAAIIHYLQAATLNMQHAIWELGAHNETYAMANITGITTHPVYLNGQDTNISLLGAFAKQLEELEGDVLQAL